MCIIFLTSFLVTQSSANAPTAASIKKPNILVILADDVGTGDIPLYWNSGLVDMPNVQRLANMGVTFKDAHSLYAAVRELCASRSKSWWYMGA